MTPGPGQYPWQCFLPCGLGFLYGNGGPMQTVGLHGRIPQGGGVSEPCEEVDGGVGAMRAVRPTTSGG